MRGVKTRSADVVGFEPDKGMGWSIGRFTNGPDPVGSSPSMLVRFLSSAALKLAVCLVAINLPGILCATKPLSAAAGSMAGTLANGIIVTAEGSNGEVKYSLAGKGVPADVPPERVVF